MDGILRLVRRPRYRGNLKYSVVPLILPVAEHGGGGAIDEDAAAFKINAKNALAGRLEQQAQPITPGILAGSGND